MFIVPFIHKVTQEHNLYIHSIRLLTIGGKTLWEENNSLNIDEDVLNPNDIWRKGAVIAPDKHLKLCEVDTDKTSIADFYNWNEIPFNDEETFCWRNYVYLVGLKGESWLNIPNTERFGTTSLNKVITAIIHQKDTRSI